MREMKEIGVYLHTVQKWDSSENLAVVNSGEPNVCACVCLLVVMICSQVKGKWMHLLMPSVCVCVLHVKHTAGHKGQIEESGVSRLFSI